MLLLEAGPDYPNLEALPEDLRNGNHGSFFDHDWGLRYTPSSTSEPRPAVRARARHRRLVGREHARSPCAAYRRTTTSGRRSAAPTGRGSSVLPAFIRLENDPRLRRPTRTTAPSGPLPIRRHTARRARAVPGGVPRCLRRARLPGVPRPQRPGGDRLRPAPDEQARSTCASAPRSPTWRPRAARPNLHIRARHRSCAASSFEGRRCDGRRGAHGRRHVARRSRRRRSCWPAARSTRRRCSCAPASARARCSTGSAIARHARQLRASVGTCRTIRRSARRSCRRKASPTGTSP